MCLHVHVSIRGSSMKSLAEGGNLSVSGAMLACNTDTVSLLPHLCDG